MIFEHGERLAFGGVEIADHLLAHELVETHARERAEAFGLLAPVLRRFVGGGAKCCVEAALVIARLADRLLDGGQRIASGEHRLVLLPAGDAAGKDGHLELGLEIAAALLGKLGVLHDAVRRLVAANGVEGRDRNAHRKARHGLRLVGLVVADGKPHRKAALIDRIDDDEIGAALEARMLAEEAGLVFGPPGDQEPIVLPHLRGERIEIGDHLARFSGVAALNRGLSLRVKRIGKLTRIRHLRFGDDRLVERIKVARQDLRKLDARVFCRLPGGAHDLILIVGEKDREDSDSGAEPLAVDAHGEPR